MKYVKMLGLAAIAAAALMAFVGAGSASAAELTCNGVKCPVGTIIHAETPAGTHAILHPPIGAIECNSTVEGEVTDAGSNAAGDVTPAKGKITKLLFEPCTGGAVVTTLKAGSLEIESNGSLKSVGAEVTVQAFGFHCIFGTGTGTKIGTVTTNTNKPGDATLDIEANIPRTGGSSSIFCGSTAQWTGSYTTTKPTTLVVH